LKSSEALKQGKKILKHIALGQEDALELLSFASGKNKSLLLGNIELADNAFNKYIALINRRAKKEPIDSIIGHTLFNGIKVLFNPHTLTPRKESELLADMVVKEIGDRQNLKVLDLCCGSGCIGVSIAKNTNALVTCADISEYALTHTRQTADNNGVQVEIIKTDMLNNIVDKYDIIVCNPPYIDKIDMEKLETEVNDYDPALALYGGNDGMDFYKILAKTAHKNLTCSGKMFLELDHKNAYNITLLFKNYSDIQIKKDYSNLNRFLIASNLKLV